MSKKGLKDQLELANKKGVKYVVILGQKEISDGTVLIRDMESGVQEVVDFRKIKTELRKRLESESVRLIKVKKKII
jgi:histidyl-tRNA synthetase